MFLVGGIVDCFQETVVARDTAAVFGLPEGMDRASRCPRSGLPARRAVERLRGGAAVRGGVQGRAVVRGLL